MALNLEKSYKALWRLFMTTHSILVNAIEQDLAQAGLPPLAWYDVLAALSESPEHKLRMHELASTMLLDRSNLTRLVDRMEVAGLVCRKSCVSDRRGAFAALTEAGQVMQQKMQSVYEQAVVTYFARHLNDAEVQALTKALERIQVEAQI
ncbi:MAG: MarR family transcriptional regulator [Chroococcidiopsidaceae cyanobacterium CP_BM_ER_R8_30]|nr:MarR family transcriptional regulator [Chroococcidiopsidaceae cyanobacterium CP_BM_ER_R8_30]